MGPGRKETIRAVAIAQGEVGFIEEWVAYHRLISADHFFVYDDDLELPLRSVLALHREIVTVSSGRLGRS